MKRITFALYFGNRVFFPESLVSKARAEMKTALELLGYQVLLMDEDKTRYGAVETAEEGRKYAAFLQEHRGEYDGVILSLPNFGDENGAIAALRDCGVPILIQAYPDEIGKMDFKNRRDAFCGKFSIMDVFYQYKLPFSVCEPHTVHPESEEFKENIRWFEGVCRVANNMRGITVGAIGARTTAFKTVRFDEITLQKYGITTEAVDLSELFARFRDIKTGTDKFIQKKHVLKNYSNWEGVPDEKADILAKIGIALDDIICEYRLDCLALRCWAEIEKELGVAPCVLLSEMNDRLFTSACELDVCNAIPMHALSLASKGPSTCLDWNNNYGDDKNKCILFHCGVVPRSMMREGGRIIDHCMLSKSLGPGSAWGCNVGRIAASPITFGSSKTEEGKLVFYIDEGRFTDDPIDEGFFGNGGVAEIADLQKKLLSIGKNGFRHHVSVTFGTVGNSVKEAFSTYLGFDLMQL